MGRRHAAGPGRTRSSYSHARSDVRCFTRCGTFKKVDIMHELSITLLSRKTLDGSRDSTTWQKGPGSGGDFLLYVVAGAGIAPAIFRLCIPTTIFIAPPFGEFVVWTIPSPFLHCRDGGLPSSLYTFTNLAHCKWPARLSVLTSLRGRTPRFARDAQFCNRLERTKLALGS